MKLTLNGTEYQSKLFALLNPSIGEARIIKRHTGMSISEWRLGLMTLHREDPDVLAGLVFILKHRAGEQVDWSELEQLSSQELNEAITVEDGDLDPPAPVEPAAAPETSVETPAPKKAPAKRTPKPKAAAAS